MALDRLTLGIAIIWISRLAGLKYVQNAEWAISPGILCHTVTSEIVFGDLTSDLYFDLYPVPSIQRLSTQLNITSSKQICEIPLLEQCISSICGRIVLTFDFLFSFQSR